MNQSLAKRYTVALFQMAEESRQTKKILADMQLIRQCLEGSDELQQFVQNPVMSYEQRVSVIQALFADKVQDLTCVFLKFLIQKQRLSLLGDIALTFEELDQQSEGVLKAWVASSHKITTSQKNHIKDRLKKRLHQDVTLHCDVDETILGGFRIQIQDQVFDCTLDDQLDRFKERVLKG